MKAHILQHVPFEDIGSIKFWLDAQQAETTRTRFFENDSLPGISGLDLVVVMGGPMSVNDEDAFSWLIPEKAFIRNAVQEGIPVVGICLGAQLIAGALGARVYRNAHREIGWFHVIATPCTENCFRLPKQCLAFHWHGETFDLPPGAVHLAKSAGCENQAFQIGKNVIGLQFHLETTNESLQSLVANCRGDLIPGPYVQSERELLDVSAATYTAINATMGDLLTYLTT